MICTLQIEISRLRTQPSFFYLQQCKYININRIKISYLGDSTAVLKQLNELLGLVNKFTKHKMSEEENVIIYRPWQ